MNLEELKLLNDVELQEVHQKAVSGMQELMKDGNKSSKEDFLTNMKLVVDAGQLLRERGIIKEEPIKQETEEEKEERILKFKEQNRKEDIGYIVKGVLLLLLGIFLSSMMDGKYLFYGAILMGVGFIGLGLYSLIKNS